MKIHVETNVDQLQIRNRIVDYYLQRFMPVIESVSADMFDADEVEQRVLRLFEQADADYSNPTVYELSMVIDLMESLAELLHMDREVVTTELNVLAALFPKPHRKRIRNALEAASVRVAAEQLLVQPN